MPKNANSNMRVYFHELCILQRINLKFLFESFLFPFKSKNCIKTRWNCIQILIFNHQFRNNKRKLYIYSSFFIKDVCLPFFVRNGTKWIFIFTVTFDLHLMNANNTWSAFLVFKQAAIVRIYSVFVVCI